MESTPAGQTIARGPRGEALRGLGRGGRLRPQGIPSSSGVRVPVSRVLSLAIGLAVMATTFVTDAHAGIREPFVHSSTTKLSPGIRYVEGSMRAGRRNLIQMVRVAKIRPYHHAVRLRSLLSNDLVIGLEKPTLLVQRHSGPGMVPMVATNGDAARERRQDGYAAPHSMAVTGGELLVAQACTRPTLGIDSAGLARIDDVRAHITMSLPGRKVAKRIHRVNAPRDDGAFVLYTPRFAASTQTAPGGVEVVLSLPDMLRPQGIQEVQVLEVRPGAGDSPLVPGTAVLSVRDPRHAWLTRLQPGQKMRLQTSVVKNVDSNCGGTIEAAPGWADTQEAIGGNYFTLRNGVIAAPSAEVYAASVQRHPRTNVGITPDGRVLMVTVDGRQPRYSAGVTLAEMGQLMASLGAVHAVNLDGGGSTLMARHIPTTGRFRVVNRPSDGRQRLATQALAAFQYTPGY